jgi:DNA replicative helicase MCM subunit Mcm2 (Cdc46/Mcm family)
MFPPGTSLVGDLTLRRAWPAMPTARCGLRGTTQYLNDLRGLWGAATARAEAYVLRLSMIYALMDGTAQIEKQHVEAAIAVWDYCSESARLIFGDRTGHTDVDKLIDTLEAVGRQGLTRTEQTKLFKNAKRKARQARETAMQLGLVAEIERPTATRPQQVLYLNQHAPVIGGE